MEVGANCEEVKSERINDKTKLMPPVDMSKKTVRPLCLIDLSVPCWVFVSMSFLKNLKI